MSPIDRMLHLFPRGPLSQTADDFATLANTWREPQSILPILTIIGGDIVQGALAQLVSPRPRHFAPAAFSFGWVAYAFSAVLAIIGSRRLAPNPDCDCVLIDIGTGYARNVRSWPLARLVRDYELPPEAVPSDGGAPRGLTVTFYRTCSQKRTGVVSRDWIYYTGIIVILLQLTVAVIPGALVGNWVIFILTFGGILLVQAHASLPQWQKELWGARQITEGKREVVCLTRGNGSSYVLVIISNGCGLKLSDLAAGREVLSKTTAPATFLLAVLWLVHLFCVGGLKRDTWYLLAIGAIGMVQNALASGARRVPSALGFHLKVERVVHRDKVFDALKEAEEVEAKVGVRLTDIFFPGGLRPDEEVWKQDKLNEYAEEGRQENAAPTGSTELPSSSSSAKTNRSNEHSPLRIYLARVRERPDKSLYLERKSNASTSDSYIAISHVWGDPATIQSMSVEGFDEPVQLSPLKQDILPILHRRDVCGSKYFWMDLFCIDQRPNATIGISEQLKAIPQIYKSSQCVKVLIESPVCVDWQRTALRAAEPQPEEETFSGFESIHSRKCSSMLILDSWFDRLWTRQEGLYAQNLDVVLLNPVECTRLIPSRQRGGPQLEAEIRRKKEIVQQFIVDKLATMENGMHRVCVSDYTAVLSGPHPSYSPIQRAWGSGRKTAKERDYVLAVFPDIPGYRPPPNSRQMKFSDLLQDAFNQLDKEFSLIPKVPKGLVSPSSPIKNEPWIYGSPENIVQAFDTFLLISSSESGGVSDTGNPELRVVSRAAISEPISFVQSELPNIKAVWESTTDRIKHVGLLCLHGPCLGIERSGTTIESSEQELHFFFTQQFGGSAIQAYDSIQNTNILSTHTPFKMIDTEKLNISPEFFSRELRRYMVCLICGTSLRTADEILRYAELRKISWKYGQMFSLINRSILHQWENSGHFLLISSKLWPVQGLLVGLSSGNSFSIVGRTIIPPPEFCNFAPVHD